MKSCDEVEITGKHAPRKKSVSKRSQEEAWRLLERMPGFRRKTREMFEEELTRKVRNAPDNSSKEREKAVQEWSSDMQKSCPDQKNGNARPGRG